MSPLVHQQAATWNQLSIANSITGRVWGGKAVGRERVVDGRSILQVPSLCGSRPFLFGLSRRYAPVVNIVYGWVVSYSTETMFADVSSLRV